MAKAQMFAANPAVLVWARERWGLDVGDAASAPGIERGRLERIEGGEEIPTVGLLEGMTKVYQLAFTNFVLREPPRGFEDPTDFRTVGGEAPRYSRETRQAITLTHVDQDAATDLARDLGRQVAPDLERATLSQNVEELAVGQRSLLGVDDAAQRDWKDARAAFRQWRVRIERLGILVFLRAFPREDCRGFSSWPDDLMPAIVVNRNEEPQAQVFTLLHEYAHLLLRQPGLCDQNDLDDQAKVERFCNRFAAAVLMPRDTVRRLVGELGLPAGQNWERGDVGKLARALKVSRPAAMLRVEELGIAARGSYRRLGYEWDEDTWRPERKGGGGSNTPYARQYLNRLGTSYVQLVFDALEARLIDDTDADLRLGLRIKHFGDLRGELVRETGGTRERAWGGAGPVSDRYVQPRWGRTA